MPGMLSIAGAVAATLVIPAALRTSRRADYRVSPWL